MELDIFIPDLNLALEYQGEQHYQNIFRFSEQKIQMERDREKKQACKQSGITLIEVPYWWTQTKETLVTIIHAANPELDL
jgi:hypothetical protein